MPISYQILLDHSLTYVRYSGTVDADQVVRSARAYAQDPDFRPALHELADLREIVEFDMSFRTMSNMFYRIGKLHEIHGAPASKVLLAGSETSFGMARMFENIVAMAGGPPVHVTRSESEALLCLGRQERSVADLLSAPPAHSERIQA